MLTSQFIGVVVLGKLLSFDPDPSDFTLYIFRNSKKLLYTLKANKTSHSSMYFLQSYLLFLPHFKDLVGRAELKT